MRPARVCLFAVLLACGPTAPSPQSDESSSSDVPADTTVAPTPTTTTVDATTTAASTTTTSSASTTAVDPSTSAGSTDGDGMTFILMDDFICLTASGARCVECDLFLQDCPRGQKCTSWGSGGGSWDAHRCVPVDPDPDHAGEPCTVEGSASSGIDSCDAASMCWNVDKDLLTGTCVPFCAGAPETPECPADTSCLIANDGALSLCLPACDPLAPACAPDEVCALVEQTFFCVPDASGDDGQTFDPCDSINDCDPGLTCLDPSAAVECDPSANGCCLPFCDLTQPPNCPGADQTCTPFFPEGEAPPEHADLGVCALAPP